MNSRGNVLIFEGLQCPPKIFHIDNVISKIKFCWPIFKPKYLKTRQCPKQVFTFSLISILSSKKWHRASMVVYVAEKLLHIEYIIILLIHYNWSIKRHHLFKQWSQVNNTPSWVKVLDLPSQPSLPLQEPTAITGLCCSQKPS